MHDLIWKLGRIKIWNFVHYLITDLKRNQLIVFFLVSTDSSLEE